MPIELPVDGDTSWGTEVRAAIAGVNALEGTTTANLPETIRDTVATALVAGTGITITPNDGADTISIAASATAYTDEQARDTIAAMLIATGGITATYDDGAETLTLTGAVTATTQSGTSYTLTLANAGTAVETTSASAVAVTVPPNSSVAFPIGTTIELLQYGSGQITVTPGVGVTVRTHRSLTSRAQYSTLTLRKRATNEWILSGDAT